MTIAALRGKTRQPIQDINELSQNEHFVKNDGWPFLKSASVLKTRLLGMAICQMVRTLPTHTPSI